MRGATTYFETSFGTRCTAGMRSQSAHEAPGTHAIRHRCAQHGLGAFRAPLIVSLPIPNPNVHFFRAAST